MNMSKDRLFIDYSAFKLELVYIFEIVQNMESVRLCSIFVYCLLSK